MQTGSRQAYAQYQSEDVQTQQPQIIKQPVAQQSGGGQTQSTMIRQAAPPVHMQIQSHSEQQLGTPVQAYYSAQQQAVASGQQAQPVQRAVAQRVYYDNGPSYFENMVSKRRDVLKIIILAVTIVLGISVHALVDFVLREMTVGKELDFKQEFGLRLLYPALVVLVIWLLKAIGK